MRKIKGPGLFLAQFAQDTAPHNSLPTKAKWAKDYGYKAIQIPSWDRRLFDPEKRRRWAAEQVRKAARVPRRRGLSEHVSFTGALAWPFFYPYPQRPAGLVEECFAEQGRRWMPILDVYEDI